MTKLIEGDQHIQGEKKIAFSYSDQGGLWRKLNNIKPLFSRNEELFVSKEIKENALASEGKSSIMPTRNNNLRKSVCVS